MGQQQLLLLILSAVIVGVAIVMGINMFSENAAQANQDAVMQDCLSFASRAQAWYRRPAQLGGGDNSYTGLSYANANFDSVNANGSYTFAITGGGDSLAVTGLGVEDGNGDGNPLQVIVRVGPAGVTSTEINP